MINKYSNVPLYSQLKQLIVDKIDSGEYSSDSKIPSEQDLCQLYDISRPTVRQAISELTSSGSLYKLKGKGTFVSRSKKRIDIKDYSGFSDSLLDSDIPGDREIISINLVTGKSLPKLNELFSILPSPSREDEFAQVTYVSKYENETLSLNVSYIPVFLFPTIIEDVKAKKPSYDILKGKYPLLPARTTSAIEIVYTEQNDAAYLQIQAGVPLIRVVSTIYSKNGQAIEYIVSKYRADKSRLTFEAAK